MLQAPVSPKSNRVLQGTQTPKSRSEKKSRKMSKQDEEKMQQLMFKTFIPPKRKKDKEEKDKK